MLIELKECPCGCKNHPRTCKFMDFADSEKILYLSEMKIWGGSAHETLLEDDEDAEHGTAAEVILFQTDDGSCFRIEMHVEDMMRLGQFLIQKAFDVGTLQDLDPAITQDQVEEFENQEDALWKRSSETTQSGA